MSKINSSILFSMLILSLLSNVILWVQLSKVKKENSAQVSSKVFKQFVDQINLRDERLKEVTKNYNELKSENSSLKYKHKQLRKEYEESKIIKVDTVYTDIYFDELLREFEYEFFRHNQNNNEERHSIPIIVEQSEISKSSNFIF